MRIKVGTRPSPLAVQQVLEVEALLPGVEFDISLIQTKGDVDKITPLSRLERSDFFTREIEEALLSGAIDAAVHSAKDLDGPKPRGLVVAATTPSISPYECLVSRKRQERLDDLPRGATVGTSSQKRKAAILRYRADLLVKDIRGTINERLAQLGRGEFNAIVVAHAALIRLGYTERIAEILPVSTIEPHPLQGRLAVQVREGREDIVAIFRRIDGD